MHRGRALPRSTQALNTWPLESFSGSSGGRIAVKQRSSNGQVDDRWNLAAKTPRRGQVEARLQGSDVAFSATSDLAAGHAAEAAGCGPARRAIRPVLVNPRTRQRR